MNAKNSLPMLFSIEICEGFAFYGIGAILTLFMVQFLNLNLSFALLIYGVYSGFVYISTLLGGDICDKYIGSRTLINIGALTMMGGLILLSYGASLSHPLTPLHSSFLFNLPEIILIISLICIILGAGFLRVSISSMVSELYQKPVQNREYDNKINYEENDEKIESKFTALNMALNIGAILASLLLGLVIGEGNIYLYKYGFLILASSLVIGLIIYNVFRNKYLINEKNEKVGIKPSIEKVSKKVNEKIKLTKIEKNHIKAIIIIEIISLIFFIGFEVIDSTLMFFAKDYVLSSITYLPFKATPEMIKFIEPLGVIIFSPIIIKYFNSNKNKNSLLISKIIIGIILLLITYIIFFTLSIEVDNGVTNINIICIIIMEMIRSISEILVLPIILSIISKFGPKQYLSRLMGLFYCFLAGAYTISGFMASFFPDKTNEIIPYLFGIIPVANFKTFTLIFIVMYIFLLIFTLLTKNKIKHLMN